ncbi:MAG: YCF48-related protein [Thermodesulfobacteriota bacterium]|nr:YCF48-related protein [Thermodesulfobacteriota bacterium]
MLRLTPSLISERRKLHPRYYKYTQNRNGLYFRLNAVHLVDGKVGFAVGNRGTILRTTNGGISWELLSCRTTRHLYGVHFYDKNVGIAVGSRGTIIRTMDGGEDWSRVVPYQYTVDPLTLRGVFLSDSESAVVVGGLQIGENGLYGEQGLILLTDDGGRTWEACPRSKELDGLNAVDFINGLGFAVGGLSYYNLYDGLYVMSSIIVKTDNGGKTWIQMQSPLENPVSRIQPWSNPVWDVCFCDSLHGIIIGGPGIPPFFTDDGGASWNTSQPNTPHHTNWYSVCFADDKTAVAVGGRWNFAGSFDRIYRSTNRGLTWQEVYRMDYAFKHDFPVSLLGVSFGDPYIGVAVGLGSQILRTQDSGKTWNKVSLSV